MSSNADSSPTDTVVMHNEQNHAPEEGMEVHAGAPDDKINNTNDQQSPSSTLITTPRLSNEGENEEGSKQVESANGDGVHHTKESTDDQENSEGTSGVMAIEEEATGEQNQQQPSAMEIDTATLTKSKKQKQKQKAATSSSNNNNNNEANNLSLDDVTFPLSIGTIFKLYSIGKIEYERLGYHNDRYIFPIGYKADRVYTSYVDVNTKTTYTCEVLDGGANPLFKVTPADDPTSEYTGHTPTGAWTNIIKKIQEAKLTAGEKRVFTTVSGPEYFGFSNPKIQALIEQLPNAEKCTNYVNRHTRSNRKAEGGSNNKKRKKSGNANATTSEETPSTPTATATATESTSTIPTPTKSASQEEKPAGGEEPVAAEESHTPRRSSRSRKSLLKSLNENSDEEPENVTIHKAPAKKASETKKARREPKAPPAPQYPGLSPDVPLPYLDRNYQFRCLSTGLPVYDGNEKFASLYHKLLDEVPPEAEPDPEKEILEDENANTRPQTPKLEEGTSDVTNVDETGNVELLRSMWEFTYVCYLCKLLRPILKIEKFYAEDLEHALIKPQENNGLLADLHIKLIKGPMDKAKKAKEELNPTSHFWMDVVKDHLSKAVAKYSMMESNPLTKKHYYELHVVQRVLILKALCDFNIDDKDGRAYEQRPTGKALRPEINEEELRIEPIGYDKNGDAYYYFGDEIGRLFVETMPLSKRTDDGTPTGEIAVQGNWKLVSSSLSELTTFAEGLDKTNVDEKHLHDVIMEYLVPELEATKAARDRERRKKQIELAPTKRSSRIQQKETQRMEQEQKERERAQEEEVRRREQERISRETRLQEKYRKEVEERERQKAYRAERVAKRASSPAVSETGAAIDACADVPLRTSRSGRILKQRINYTENKEDVSNNFQEVQEEAAIARGRPRRAAAIAAAGAAHDQLQKEATPLKIPRTKRSTTASNSKRDEEEEEEPEEEEEEEEEDYVDDNNDEDFQEEQAMMEEDADDASDDEDFNIDDEYEDESRPRRGAKRGRPRKSASIAGNTPSTRRRYTRRSQQQQQQPARPSGITFTTVPPVQLPSMDAIQKFLHQAPPPLPPPPQVLVPANVVLPTAPTTDVPSRILFAGSSSSAAAAAATLAGTTTNTTVVPLTTTLLVGANIANVADGATITTTTRSNTASDVEEEDITAEMLEDADFELLDNDKEALNRKKQQQQQQQKHTSTTTAAAAPVQ